MDPADQSSHPLPTPPPSFLQAMDQLNQVYPPNQPRSRSNTALQPSAAPGSPPPSSLASGRNLSSPSRPKIQSPPPMPLTPQQSAMQARHYMEIAAKFTNHQLKDWVPHSLTPAERQQFLDATRRKVAHIRGLEAEQQRTAPHVENRIEQALFMARLDYRVHFPRIFRINDLPTEIMNNIFSYVVWSPTNQATSVKWRVWLTWTCHHWRTVATADTTLWNAIWFRDRPRYERSLTFFERAGYGPIDIRIDDTKEQPLTMKTMSDLVEKLFTKLSNIRLLVVVVQDWDPALVVLDALRRVAEENLPMMLNRLELHRDGSPYIQIGSGYEPGFYLTPIPLFGGATVPSFKYLSLNGVHIDWKRSVLKNLTTIDIRRLPLERTPNLKGFRDLLLNSPALTKLILDGAGPKWDKDAVTLPPVLLRELKVLVLGDFSMAYGCFLFSQIAVPNVIDLTLINLFDDDFSPFFKILTSNVPSVKILTVFSARLLLPPPAKIIAVKWLQSMPHVTYLRIGSVNKPFLDLFLMEPEKLTRASKNPSSRRHQLCPNLFYLEFQNIPPDLIAEWVVIRKRMGSPLKKIYVTPTMAEKITREHHNRLSEGLDNGGSINILVPNVKPPEEEQLSRS